MVTGTIKVWNADKGWGFISRTDGGGADLFCHIKFCRVGFVPSLGAAVSCEVVPDEHAAGHRARADDVRAA
jgi:cold shock CspA family protein